MHNRLFLAYLSIILFSLPAFAGNITSHDLSGSWFGTVTIPIDEKIINTTNVTFTFRDDNTVTLCIPDQSQSKYILTNDTMDISISDKMSLRMTDIKLFNNMLFASFSLSTYPPNLVSFIMLFKKSGKTNLTYFVNTNPASISMLTDGSNHFELSTYHSDFSGKDTDLERKILNEITAEKNAKNFYDKLWNRICNESSSIQNLDIDSSLGKNGELDNDNIVYSEQTFFRSIKNPGDDDYGVMFTIIKLSYPKPTINVIPDYKLDVTTNIWLCPKGKANGIFVLSDREQYVDVNNENAHDFDQRILSLITNAIGRD